VEALSRIVRVLDLFSVDDPEWGVYEVAAELRLPKSSVSELMSDMASHGLLRRTHRRRYRLGWKVFELSQTLLDTTEFRTESRKVMSELVEVWKETTQMAVLDGVQAVYVEKMQPKPAPRILFSRIGARLPAYCTGVGKTLLAGRNWIDIVPMLEEQGLVRLTQNTITSLDALKEELQAIRERGYAYDYEESVVGLCCVAAPIHDAKGQVIAAISLSVPAYRFEAGKDDYATAILDAARKISISAADGL